MPTGRWLPRRIRAARGETLVLYATGLGATTPALLTGALPTVLTQTPNAAYGNGGRRRGAGCLRRDLGLLRGLNQVNFVVPAGAPTGATVAVVVSVGPKQSNPVTIVIQ